jgi:hypothetical protein
MLDDGAVVCSALEHATASAFPRLFRGGSGAIGASSSASVSQRQGRLGGLLGAAVSWQSRCLAARSVLEVIEAVALDSGAKAIATLAALGLRASDDDEEARRASAAQRKRDSRVTHADVTRESSVTLQYVTRGVGGVVSSSLHDPKTLCLEVGESEGEGHADVTPNVTRDSQRTTRSRRRTKKPLTGVPELDAERDWAIGWQIPFEHQEFRNFIEHHRKKDNQWADWKAAWRQWLQNVPAFAPRSHQAAATPGAVDYEAMKRQSPLRAKPAPLRPDELPVKLDPAMLPGFLKVGGKP